MCDFDHAAMPTVCYSATLSLVHNVTLDVDANAMLDARLNYTALVEVSRYTG